MNVGVQIRQANEEDLPEILRLYAQPAIDDGATLSVDVASKLFRRITSYPSYTLYVACRDNEIVGTFALLIMDNLGHSGAPSGIVDDVAVHPEHHRAGIGKAMMMHAMATCRTQGCYKISLSANLKRTDAHLFYESLGFEKHGYSYVVDLT